MKIVVNCWNLQAHVFHRVFYVPVGLNFDNCVLLIFFTNNDGLEDAVEIPCTYFTININEVCNEN